MRVFSAM